MPLCPHALLDDGLLDLTILLTWTVWLASTPFRDICCPVSTILNIYDLIQHFCGICCPIPHLRDTYYLIPLFPVCCGKARRRFAPNKLRREVLGSSYESKHDLNINLDGEPRVMKRFRVECRKRLLPVRLGKGSFLSSHRGRT